MEKGWYNEVGSNGKEEGSVVNNSLQFNGTINTSMLDLPNQYAIIYTYLK